MRNNTTKQTLVLIIALFFSTFFVEAESESVNATSQENEDESSSSSLQVLSADEEQVSNSSISTPPTPDIPSSWTDPTTTPTTTTTTTPSTTQATTTTTQRGSIVRAMHTLEKVFGKNFLNLEGDSTNSSEEFQAVEEEFMEPTERTTSTSTTGVPMANTTASSLGHNETEFPILIPSLEGVSTESGLAVVEEEEGDYYHYEEEELDDLDEEEEEYHYPHHLFHQEETPSNNTSTSVRTKGRIKTSAHFRRTCGDRLESCDKAEKDGGRPASISFGRYPHYCRCDRGVCDEFGDCCWTVASTLLYRNPWRCHRVQHENVWALMISKCSEHYRSAPTVDKDLIVSCESPATLPPYLPYTHLHDIPVYSNDTSTLYRNVFCARCNHIPVDELLDLNLTVKCTKKLNNSEREAFRERAKYQRGKRVWLVEEEDVSNRTACGIYSPELDDRRNKASVVISNLRFCRRNTVDKCPLDYVVKNPEVAALCNSYTQLVESRVGLTFKNPHCAQCYGLDTKWDLRCLKDSSLLATLDEGWIGSKNRFTPSAAGASLDSLGLSLIFDFDLGSDYVGYESTCPDDMIWDFLRQRCTAVMCKKDHELDKKDGRCKPKKEEDETYDISDHDEEDEGTPQEGVETTEKGMVEDTSSKDDEQSHENDNSTSTTPTPTTTTIATTPGLGGGKNHSEERDDDCYILIIHESEYTLLPNKSILVHTNATPGVLLLLSPSEYEVWNSSSVSICARDLSSNFRQRFSPALNTVSTVALGLSAFFSLAHLSLFLVLPKLRNLPGKNLFCLTASLLTSQVLFLSFITSKVAWICVGASILMHYFFLASFFWMNVMSWDIWRTFSSHFMVQKGSGRLFLKYSLWGWGSPGVIVTCATLIDFLLSESHSKVLPLYGHNNLCWIGQGLSLFLFFALPAALLIALNIALFTLSTGAILEASRDSQKAFNNGEKLSRKTSQSSQDSSEVKRMKLYAKLGVIMGVTWILGFVGGLAEWDWMWYLFVILNGGQGTFIFFGFDAKPKVWRMLRERFSRKKNEIESRRTTTTTTSSSSNSNRINDAGTLTMLEDVGGGGVVKRGVVSRSMNSKM